MAATRQTPDHEDRGRAATRPGEIPAQGWWDIVRRVYDELNKDNISIVAAGVAFYALLAIFPTLVVMVSIYGLAADPTDVQQHFEYISGILPQEARVLLSEQLGRVAAQSGAALSLGIIIGLLAALWSATQGIKSLIIALNIVYDEEEKRGFLKLSALAVLLTLAAIVFTLLALGLVVALPALIGYLGLPENIETLLSLLRWPLLAFCVILGLAVLYHYAPSRNNPQWQWVSWGAVVATLLWIIGSALFSFYVANFGEYNETYGSVGAIIILLMWFFLTAYIVLLGAEFNAEMEHQTEQDTTQSGPKPMGERQAYVADTVGNSYDDK